MQLTCSRIKPFWCCFAAFCIRNASLTRILTSTSGLTQLSVCLTPVWTDLLSRFPSSFAAVVLIRVPEVRVDREVGA
ncbi:MAG: hypothetical protein ACE1Y4_02745, partial [Lysobacterales bacterium]